MPKRRRDSVTSCSSNPLLCTPRHARPDAEGVTLSKYSTADQQRANVKPRVAEIIRTNLPLANIVLRVVRIVVEKTAKEEAEVEAEMSKLRNGKSRKRTRDQLIFDVSGKCESGMEDSDEGNMAYRLFLSDGDRVIQGSHHIPCSRCPGNATRRCADCYHRRFEVGNASFCP